jgi:hypothetical protein
LVTTGHYKSGKRDGLWTVLNQRDIRSIWGSEGKEQYTYSSGEKHGMTRWWTTFGNYGKGHYANNQRTGHWIEWYANKKKAWECEYKNGRLHGRCIRWYPHGKKMLETNYRNNLPHGWWMRWQDSNFGKTEGYYYGEGRLLLHCERYPTTKGVYVASAYGKFKKEVCANIWLNISCTYSDLPPYNGWLRYLEIERRMKKGALSNHCGMWTPRTMPDDIQRALSKEPKQV